MLNRPEAIGLKINLESIEDVDAALHEMGWLNGRKNQVEADHQAKIEAIKQDAQSKMVVEIEGKTLTFDERFEELADAVHEWCAKNLKGHLPPNQKSKKLSHGVLKLRGLPAAVGILEGKKPADVALSLAREAGILAGVDELLAREVDAFPLSKLLVAEFSLAKDAIKAEAAKSPEFAEFLKSRAITIENDRSQITVEPAAVQVSTQTA